LTPVAAEVQAGGVYVGTVDTSGPLAPLALKAANRGMTPRSVIGSRRCQAAPSSPMTTALLTATHTSCSSSEVAGRSSRRQRLAVPSSDRSAHEKTGVTVVGLG
jgi:hypothetical protein